MIIANTNNQTLLHKINQILNILQSFRNAWSYNDTSYSNGFLFPYLGLPNWKNNVLNIEWEGTNEALHNLYGITNDTSYLLEDKIFNITSNSPADPDGQDENINVNGQIGLNDQGDHELKKNYSHSTYLSSNIIFKKETDSTEFDPDTTDMKENSTITATHDLGAGISNTTSINLNCDGSPSLSTVNEKSINLYPTGRIGAKSSEINNADKLFYDTIDSDTDSTLSCLILNDVTDAEPTIVTTTTTDTVCNSGESDSCLTYTTNLSDTINETVSTVSAAKKIYGDTDSNFAILDTILTYDYDPNGKFDYYPASTTNLTDNVKHTIDYSQPNKVFVLDKKEIKKGTGFKRPIHEHWELKKKKLGFYNGILANRQAIRTAYKTYFSANKTMVD